MYVNGGDDLNYNTELKLKTITKSKSYNFYTMLHYNDALDIAATNTKTDQNIPSPPLPSDLTIDKVRKVS